MEVNNEEELIISGTSNFEIVKKNINGKPKSIVRYSGEFCMDDGTVLDALQYIKLAIEKVQRHR
jgi:hypothetical protein